MSIAWLFPGQGSQAVGMGQDVAATFPAARAVFERADAALGEPLSRLIAEGPEAELTLTQNTQPALVCTSAAILAAIRESWPGLPPPAFAAGHSLGEYSALVAADALSLEDALRVVRVRGRAMQDAVPAGTGAMSAIMGIAPDKLASMCSTAAQGEVLAPANYNAPGQIVVAGHAQAVARLTALVEAEKGRAIALKVSAPFHCALMAPAARAVETALSAVSVREASFPIIANYDAEANRDPRKTSTLLVRQVDSPVRWEETIRGMAAGGVTAALEIGPGKVLAGLVKRIAKDIKVLSVGDVEAVKSVEAFVTAAA
jgi:[acyl-carrier-protein] S-malonyltransferase